MSEEAPYRLGPRRSALTAKGVVARGLVVVLGALMFVSWLLTQRAAWRLGYHSVLGKSWLPAIPGYEMALEIGAWVLCGVAVLLLVAKRTRILTPLALAFGAASFAWSLGPIYTPFHYFVWAKRLASSGTAGFWRSGFEILGLVAVAVLVIAAIGVAIVIKRIDNRSDLHGSARWATEEDVRAAGLFSRTGLILGRWPGRKGDKGILRHDGPEHVFVFAPTRSGKGVSLVVPNLLSWPHSV